jgi:hypothetical protein
MSRFKASFKVTVLAMLCAVLLGTSPAQSIPGLNIIDGVNAATSAAKQKERRADKRGNVDVDVDRRDSVRRDVDVDLDVDRDGPGR